MDLQAELKNLEPTKDFLVAVDSDGCAFDTMEIKHKECFIPKIVRHWELQPVSKFARAAAEFVNLYSKWRGVNRFPALIKVFELLEEWSDVKKRNVEIPRAESLRKWIESTSNLSNPALKEEVGESGDPILANALEWSEAVNATIADMVYGIPPFPYVRESIETISEWADVIVCSATPIEALRREWQEHDLAQYVRVIAGQEMGSKAQHIELASKGKYPDGNVLMIGDAPGDRRAALANDADFFPINPGEEEKSWERFHSEGAGRFRKGEFSADYGKSLVAEFEGLLPAEPSWKMR